MPQIVMDGKPRDLGHKIWQRVERLPQFVTTERHGSAFWVRPAGSEEFSYPYVFVIVRYACVELRTFTDPDRPRSYGKEFWTVDDINGIVQRVSEILGRVAP